jgi:hypothetical protein
LEKERPADGKFAPDGLAVGAKLYILTKNLNRMNMRKTGIITILLLVSFSLAGLVGCTGTTGQTNANAVANGDSNVGRVPHSGGECAEGGGEPATAIGSPIEAYTFLFESVKKGDTAAVKQVSSQATRELAQFMSSSYKKTCADAYKNGFTETTMQEKMPQTRDVRISEDGNVAAIEVMRGDGKWEDILFVKEGNGWKLASGDIFFGKIKSPGKPQSVREQENANARGVTNMNAPINPFANKKGGNNNSFQAVPVPNENVEKPMLKNRQPGQPGH